MDSPEPTDLILRGADDLATRSRRLSLDANSGALRLARADRLRLADSDTATAAALLAGQRPLLCDSNRSLAWIDATGTRLLTGPLANGQPDETTAQAVRASAPDATAASTELLELAPVEAPAGTRFTALAMRDRRIALSFSDDAADHGLAVVELGSKRHYRLALDGAPLLVDIDPEQRIWIITADDRLLRCAGEPLPQPWRPAADAFRPLQDNPHPLSVQQVIPLGGEGPGAAAVRALCSDAERLYLLDGQAISALSLIPPFNHWQRFQLDPDLTAAVTDARALGGGRLALWLPLALDDSEPLLDCPIVELDQTQARLVLERWPRRAPRHNAFVANPEALPLYLSALAPEYPDGGVLALTPLPQARYQPFATAILTGSADSRLSDTLWDRIRLIACIPEGTQLRLHARAFDADEQRAGLDWHDQGAPVPVAPATDWELPLADYRAGDKGTGLWELVLRREQDRGAVRELRGRWLQLKVQMTGNGLVTPRLYSIAVRHPRRSWQRLHLPEFMQQGDSPVEDARGLANGADVRERMLAAFAGVLEPLATRIDGAEKLFDPRTAPAALLPTLAASLGEDPPAHWPEPRRRVWLAMAGELQRWRGTYKGLVLALDIATDGAVSRGQVVPVEDWRLRRPLFTALGIDFAAKRHPLTLGTVQSGNSIVGDTLTLGPDDARTLLLALLPEADPDAPIPTLLKRFADRHAYRLSLVIHGSAGHLRGVIEELLATELPAHVSATLIETEAPFVPGLAPLLGIHSFLERFPAWRRMVLDRERIGSAAVLMNEPLLAPGRNLSPAPNGDL